MPADHLKRRERIRQAYEHALRSPEGDTVLLDLVDHTGFTKEIFSPDALVTAYHAGRRSVMLHILAILTSSRDEVEELTRRIRRRALDEDG